MVLERRRSSSSMPAYVPMRDILERLFDGGGAFPRAMVDQMQLPMPAANLRVTDDEVIIELSAPGVDPENIAISVTGDTVTIGGEIVREQHDTTGQTYYEEIMEGRFQRSFVLPFPVDAQGATATIENGILTLTLPKSASAKPHRVDVQSGKGSSKSNVIEGASATGQPPASATQSSSGNGSKESSKESSSKSSSKHASSQKTNG